MQCDKCRKQEGLINESNKPPYDYFLCECYGIRKCSGFGPELDHWNDQMCFHCSLETNRCKTCGTSMINDSELND